jgi:transcriptional regulator with XRE-family HTH domain
MTGIDCRAQREAKEISQPLLAAKSGIPQWKISRFETGVYDPTREELEKLAGALAVIPTLTFDELRGLKKAAA